MLIFFSSILAYCISSFFPVGNFNFAIKDAITNSQQRFTYTPNLLNLILKKVSAKRKFTSACLTQFPFVNTQIQKKRRGSQSRDRDVRRHDDQHWSNLMIEKTNIRNIYLQHVNFWSENVEGASDSVIIVSPPTSLLFSVSFFCMFSDIISQFS